MGGCRSEGISKGACQVNCPRCEHDNIRHNEEGCQACHCPMSPDNIDFMMKEFKESQKPVKRECWIVTFQLTENMFTGQARIHFLFEPTPAEVLETFLDGEPESKAPKRVVERVRAGDYTVTKGHVMEGR